MATQQSTQIALDGATEGLFAEIASRPYLTELELLPSVLFEALAHEVQS